METATATPRRIEVAAGPPALDALADVVAAAQAGDPLAPVTVLVPSRYGALALRRELAARGGVANVRFEIAARAAELLAAPELAGRGLTPRSRALEAEAARIDLTEHPEDLGAAAHHPATVQEVTRLFRELREVGQPAVAALAATGRRGASLAHRYQRIMAQISDTYDEANLLAAARQLIHADPSGAARTLGTVVAFAPAPADRAAQQLVDSLSDGAVIIEVHPKPIAGRALSVSDPDEEAREAVREVVRLAMDEHLPLHRIVLTHPGGPYPELLHQHLEAVGVAHAGPATRTLAQTTAGTAVLGLMSLAFDGTLRREDVMAWLASAPIVDPSRRRRPPVARWDRESREAGVLEGLEQWRSRLDAHVASLGDDRHEPHPDHEHTNRPERAAATRELKAFVEVLANDLARPEPARWSTWATWAARLLKRYLPARPRGDDVDHKEVVASIDGLAQLDRLGHRPDQAAFADAVAEALDRPTARLGAYGDGMFVGPLSTAATVAPYTADAVVAVGLVEGRVPRRPTVDPLLGPGERSAAGLPEVDVDDQHRELALALSVSRPPVLFVPRGDLREANPHVSCRWLPTGVQKIESFVAGLAATPSPSSLAERDLAELWRWTDRGGDPAEHPITARIAGLGRGLAAEVARASERFTSWDGRVDPAAVPALSVEVPLSPTSLEAYATCPQRYFLGHVLRLRDTDRPEEIETIDAASRGSLVHKVLERWTAEALDDPTRPRTLERLRDLAEEVAAEFEERGLTGRSLRWRYARDQIMRELAHVFEREVATGAVPLAAEAAFGQDEVPAVIVELRRSGPAAFKGTIDRVDRMPDGTLMVTDYKTGSADRYKKLADTTVDRGTKLQLPIYGLAARQRFGPDDVAVQARYWFVSERARFVEQGYELTAERLAVFDDAVDRIADGIHRGLFPARPGDQDWRTVYGQNCSICSFSSVCSADRMRSWRAKRADPDLADYVELAEGDDEP